MLSATPKPVFVMVSINKIFVKAQLLAICTARLAMIINNMMAAHFNSLLQKGM